MAGLRTGDKFRVMVEMEGEVKRAGSQQALEDYLFRMLWRVMKAEQVSIYADGELFGFPKVLKVEVTEVEENG